MFPFYRQLKGKVVNLLWEIEGSTLICPYNMELLHVFEYAHIYIILITFFRLKFTILLFVFVNVVLKVELHNVCSC